MRIDRSSDPADGPGDAPMARRARPALDDLDAADKDSDQAVSGDGAPDGPPTRPDSAWQSQRAAAYHSRVEAVYRQYAIDHGDAGVEKLERETVTLAMHRVEGEDSQRNQVVPEDGQQDKSRLARADDRTKDGTRQALHDTTAAASDGLTPADPNDSYSAYHSGEGERALERNGWDGGDLPDDPRNYSNPKTGRFDASWYTYDHAIAAARERTGDLGPDSIKMYDYSPENGDGTGTLIGEQSPDRLRGWRIDGQDGHVNWWDWTGGKKGAGGVYGHDWFPEDPSTPGSRYIGWAPWQDSDGNPIEGN